MEDGSYQINSRTQNKIIGSGFRSQEDIYGNDADEEMRANFSAQGINDENAEYTEINQSRTNFR